METQLFVIICDRASGQCLLSYGRLRSWKPELTPSSPRNQTPTIEKKGERREKRGEKRQKPIRTWCTLKQAGLERSRHRTFSYKFPINSEIKIIVRTIPAKEVLFGSVHFNRHTDSKVRTTLYSIINNTTGK